MLTDDPNTLNILSNEIIDYLQEFYFKRLSNALDKKIEIRKRLIQTLKNTEHMKDNEEIENNEENDELPPSPRYFNIEDEHSIELIYDRYDN